MFYLRIILVGVYLVSSTLYGQQDDQQDKIGNWQVHIDTDPIDDSKKVTLMNIDTENEKILVLRCSGGSTEVYIGWRDYLGSEAYVTSRIGEEDARTREWSVSTNKTATFYPGDDSSFILRLLRAETFAARVIPYNENRVTAVWKLDGLEDAIVPLREACGW